MVMRRYNWEKLGKYLNENWGIAHEEVNAIVFEGIKEGKSPRVARGMLGYYENKVQALLKIIDDVIEDVEE
jgi:hypothetical protein